jgi:hypothetical protein
MGVSLVTIDPGTVNGRPCRLASAEGAGGGRLTPAYTPHVPRPHLTPHVSEPGPRSEAKAETVVHS